MSRAEFASGRSQLPFFSSNITVTNGGTTTTSRTLYFYLQGENPIGRNIPSAIAGPFTINPSEQLVVTIPSDTKLAGEAWTAFVLSASTTNAPATFVQIAKLPGNTELPATIVLDNDDAFALSAIAPTKNALPTNPVNGQLRGVADLSYVYEFNTESALTPDDARILGSPIGRWIKRGSVFVTNVIDHTGAGGCAQDIQDIDESQVRTPLYACDRSLGTPARFWLHNTFPSPVSSGKRVGLLIQFNSETKTQAFHGLLRLVFRGHANTVTGQLRSSYADGTPMAGVDEEVVFQARKSNLILQDDLRSGEAYVLDVYPSFDLTDLSNQVPNKAVIKIFPFFYAQAGVYSEAGAVVGDLIYGEGDRRLIVPGLGLNAKALSGSGMVDSFSFLSVGESLVTGFSVDTANQLVTVSHDGDIAVRLAPIPNTEAIRAVVGTENGVGSPSTFSPAFSVPSSGMVEISCTYPLDTSGNGTIRPDYPDVLLVGRRGRFNPQSVTIYVKRISDGEIRSFTGNAVIPRSSQTFTIDSWSSGIVIPFLPVPVNTAFGLYKPGTCAISTSPGATDFVAGDYQVAFAFEYSNTITSISHDTSNGCILTAAAGSFAETISRSQYWGSAIASSSIRDIPESDVFPWQTRRIQEGSQRLYYDPGSTAVDNGVDTWRPSWRTENQPGRLVLDEPQALVLPLLNTPPLTGPNQIAIFGDVADGRPKLRAPNNGAITELSASPSTPTPSNLSWVSLTRQQWNNMTREQWNTLARGN